MGFQLHPLIPAEAGIQEIIPTARGPASGTRTQPGRAASVFLLNRLRPLGKNAPLMTKIARQDLPTRR